MITREEVDKFKADWELEIDKYQAKDPDCMDVDEQAYYEAVQLVELLLAERDAYREIANTLYYDEFWKDGYELIDKDAKEILKQNT